MALTIKKKKRESNLQKDLLFDYYPTEHEIHFRKKLEKKSEIKMDPETMNFIQKNAVSKKSINRYLSRLIKRSYSYCTYHDLANYLNTSMSTIYNVVHYKDSEFSGALLMSFINKLDHVIQYRKINGIRQRIIVL